jgi:DNA-binding CsgD family transcriptional regulator
MTEAWPLDELAAARVDLLRGLVAFASGLGSDAPPLLLKAASRLEPLDLELARATYLDAWGAAVAAGPLAAGDMAEICRAARALPRSPRPGPVELLLDGLARLLTEGLAAAAPALRQASRLWAGMSVSASDRLQRGWMALAPPLLLWDDDSYRAILTRQVQLIRGAGALDHLPIDLQSAAQVAVWSGDFAAAAVGSGHADTVGDALRQLTETTQVGGNDWGLGLAARSRALVATGGVAKALYEEAIERLGRIQRRTEVARAHLLYGEWLRRRGRRRDAREQLRTAHALLEEIGMTAFAERARQELAATGETARKRPAPPAVTRIEALTAQEAQVAQLAREGLSNPEIGARLFISAHTVQYHLGKVFTKLGISSRNQLHTVLPGGPDASTS